ncbi:MAG: hypothetical protein J5847_05750 [Clostridia bacterium]|nr:hypothetical protein [Clostridia bacterium]MBR5753893.1 hypothetical protein [Clostridia bacterium]
MVAVLSYVACIGLWIVNTLILIIKKNPFWLLLLFFTHLFELLTVGLKTGRKFGEKDPVSIASCICFGFLWWLPLKKQMERETFTDDDFVRRPDDIVIRHD